MKKFKYLYDIPVYTNLDRKDFQIFLILNLNESFQKFFAWHYPLIKEIKIKNYFRPKVLEFAETIYGRGTEDYFYYRDLKLKYEIRSISHDKSIIIVRFGNKHEKYDIVADFVEYETTMSTNLSSFLKNIFYFNGRYIIFEIPTEDIYNDYIVVKLKFPPC